MIKEEEYFDLSTGKRITNYQIIQAYNSILVVKNSQNKYGIIKLNGKVLSEEIIVDFIYDEIFPFQDNTAIVLKDSKYGVINEDGDLVIDTKWGEINREDNCFELVEEKRRPSMFIADKNGKIVLNCKKHICSIFSHLFENGDVLVIENVANPYNAIIRNDKSKFLTDKYVAVIDEEYLFLYDDNEYYIYNRFTGEKKDINNEWKLWNQPQTLNIKNFQKGVGTFWYQALCGLIDSEGNIISRPNIMNIQPFQGELAIYSDNIGGKYLKCSGVINKKGEKILSIEKGDYECNYDCYIHKSILGHDFQSLLCIFDNRIDIKLEDNFIIVSIPEKQMHYIIDNHGNILLGPISAESIHIYNKDYYIIDNVLIHKKDIKIRYKLSISMNDDIVCKYFDTKEAKEEAIKLYNSPKFKFLMNFKSYIKKEFSTDIEEDTAKLIKKVDN